MKNEKAEAPSRHKNALRKCVAFHDEKARKAAQKVSPSFFAFRLIDYGPRMIFVTWVYLLTDCDDMIVIFKNLTVPLAFVLSSI
jgi:hypothetical protein